MGVVCASGLKSSDLLLEDDLVAFEVLDGIRINSDGRRVGLHSHAGGRHSLLECQDSGGEGPKEASRDMADFVKVEWFDVAGTGHGVL